MLTILVEYLVVARKTGPGGAGAGQPPCVTGGGAALACGRGGLAAWLARAAGWRGLTLPQQTACMAAGRRGRRQARRHYLTAFLMERRLLGQEAAAVVIPGSAAPRIRARHCRAKIGGAAEPCHVSGQR